jgi:hypothetical protein
MTKQERARMRAASASWKMSNTYHRRTLALLDALDAKDALIAELIEITEEAFEMRTSFVSLELFQQLKARAAQ